MENTQLKKQKVEETKEEKNKEDIVKEKNEETKGRKDDSAKLRYDLIPLFAQEQFVNVLTMGANKYGDRNWEKGMFWSRLIGAIKRHIAAFEKGEDYDPESGLLHMAHVMTNAAFLTEYYKIYPQGDNRILPHSRILKIGLDIDEVLADFIGHFSKKFNINHSVECWSFDPDIKQKIESIKDDSEFWLTMPRKSNPIDLHFEPHCYITSRPCDIELTRKWIHDNGFPNVPIYCVGLNESKVDVAKKAGINVFIDDRYENFAELNRNGICCFLFNAPHNQRYDVGFKRIKKFSDLKF